MDRAAFAAALTEKLRRRGVRVDLSAAATLTRALAAGNAEVPGTPAHPSVPASPTTPGTPRTSGHLYWITRICLVRRSEDLPAFDAVFAEVFGEAVPADGPRNPPSSVRTRSRPDGVSEGTGGGTTGEPGAGDAGHGRPVRGRGRAPLPWATPAPHGPPSPARVALSATEQETLAQEPFETLSDAQTAQLGTWLAGAVPHLPRRRARRRRPGRGGARVDLRATLARARRTGWEPWELARQKRVRRPRRVVVLCDVSESVRTQSAAHMHLMRALVRSPARAEAFAFATRPTRLTPVLAHGDADAALERASEAVTDRFGGTRIAGSVRELLASRHGAALRGAVVLVLSDGWDAGPPEDTAAAMARLRRRAHRVVWANPRAAARGFEPRTGGMAAALPHCDVFLPAHTFAALREVVAAVADLRRPPGAPRP
ncbi:VWA domain-containing protein [Nocardiopsis sp. HNM0947]|uniref:VWA domain-containing protein n=1 Tax=Nocardiopsis coralli TaxID=2772213 RepID=A0ABR9P449_9ACTN|nr:VWA domain-containing protein [Nocardiopsis coralli]